MKEAKGQTQSEEYRRLDVQCEQLKAAELARREEVKSLKDQS